MSGGAGVGVGVAFVESPFAMMVIVLVVFAESLKSLPRDC